VFKNLFVLLITSQSQSVLNLFSYSADVMVEQIGRPQARRSLDPRKQCWYCQLSSYTSRDGNSELGKPL